MEFIKRHYKKILFTTIYIVLSLMMLRYTFRYLGENDSFNSMGYLVFILGLVLLVVITMIVLIRFNKKSIAKQFVVIAFIWGIAFSFINPPYLVPDEIFHIHRAYDIAKGRFFYKAHEDYLMLPFGLYRYDQNIWESTNKEGMQKYVDTISTPLEKDRLIKYNSDSTGAYNFIAYLPQSVGIFIGDLLNLPTYFVLVLGRLTNLAVWILLGYLALKYISIKKELLFLLMFLPVGVQQAASISPDALLNSASFLLIAYIFHLKFVKEDVNYIDILKIVALSILIGAVKLPYILIAGLVILIPNKKISFKLLGKLAILLLIVIANIAMLIGWQTLSKPKLIDETQVAIILEDESVEEEKVTGEENIKVNWVSEVVKNPILFIEKVIDTLKGSEEFYRKSFTAFLGWFKVQPPDSFTYIILGVLLLFAIKGDEGSYILGIFDRVILFLMTAGLFTLVCLVSYSWTNIPLRDVGIFVGIQGRYFYPFIIGIYMVLQNTILKVRNSEFIVNSLRNLYVCWTLMFSLGMIINCYFVANI